MEQGLRLRCLYRYLGWNRRQCAQFFHVSERTLHNWECGATAIPFAVIKLLRVHCRHELPGKAWDGWVFHSGKLWTPEGHGLLPHDAACWSNLARRAQLFHVVLKENHRLRCALAQQAQERSAPEAQPFGGRGASLAGGSAAEGRRVAPLDLSKGHYSNLQGTNPAFMRPAAEVGHPAFWSVTTNKKGGNHGPQQAA